MGNRAFVNQPAHAAPKRLCMVDMQSLDVDV